MDKTINIPPPGSLIPQKPRGNFKHGRYAGMRDKLRSLVVVGMDTDAPRLWEPHIGRCARAIGIKVAVRRTPEGVKIFRTA